MDGAAMHKITRILVVALACTALAACTEHVDQSGNNGWDVEDDTGGDAGTDTVDDTGSDTGEDASTDTGEDTSADTGGDTGVSANVTFELVNNSGRPLYASPGAFGLNTCYGHPWLRVQHAGEHLGLADDSCIANCDSEDDPIACDLDCAVPTREQYRFGDGEIRRYAWDATAWTIQDGCEVSESMIGETLTAEFCYGGAFTNDSAQLLSRRCETVEFTVDEGDQTVRVEIEPLQPKQVTFQMVNETGKDLYAFPGGASVGRNCYGSWNSIGDSERTFTPYRYCTGLCSCDMVEQNPGEQCNVACPAVACPAPTEEVLILPSGEKRVDNWDGLITIQDEVASQTCERRVVPLADELTTTFCYAETIDDQNGYAQLGPRTCKDFTFERTTTDVIEWKLQ
jgi:hypothetical protein